MLKRRTRPRRLQASPESLAKVSAKPQATATLAPMPLPPIDSADAGDSANRPARVLMDSPLAISTRVIARRRLTRQTPRERWRRVIGLVGALLVHIVFLLGFVLGPVDEPDMPPEPKVAALHIRLIDAPEPPPPPPIRGTPPKEKGPRHKGHANQLASVSQHSSEPSTMSVAQASPATAPPVTAPVARNSALQPKPVAAPKPPVSLPKVAPTPQLQPVPVAGPPPVVVLATPTMQPPVPPKFQPEPVRAPQVEGNQPMPPPASLALPDEPPQAMPALDKPTIALTSVVPQSSAPTSVAPVHAEMPASPPVPELQAIPLPAQAAPAINLNASVNVAAPAAPRELPQVQASTVELVEAQLDAVPVSPTSKPTVASVAPTIKIDVADKASTSAVQTSIPRPELSAEPVVTAANQAVAQVSNANQATESPAKSNAETKSADAKSPSTSPNASADQTSNDHDVSTAPDATAQGSDTATPGELNGVANAPESNGKLGSQLSPTQGQGADQSAKASGTAHGAGKSDTGQVGTIEQAGASQGEKQGDIGSYVQVTPHGDTKILDHNTPNIGYKATRFDKDWTPLGESSVDTALRHAVEKTTTTHTFQLPKGVRIKCALTPLLPMALLSCGSGDPPPAPVADKVYDRMHLPSANPVVPPAPASSARSVASNPIQLDNSAECAAARISGGPPPPGCVSMTLPVKLAHPASSSSSTSWVPASDQFH